MHGSDPIPTALRIVLDELLDDPRAASIAELAKNANELLSALRPRPSACAHRAAPTPFELPRPTPRERLLFGKSDVLTRVAIRKRRAALAALCHPDTGGNADVMAELNAAADELLAGLKTGTR